MGSAKYSMMARKHWATWLPKKTATLQAQGELGWALQEAGRLAQERLLELMQQGFQEHEADEVVRSEFIQLKPEHGANLESWEREEDAALEAMFRNQTGSNHQIGERLVLCISLEADARF